MQYIATVIESNNIACCLACETLEEAKLKAKALFILGEGREMDSEEEHRFERDKKVNVGGHYMENVNLVYGFTFVTHTN